MCGQYPGAVAASATVSLKCACNLAAYRYLIVQFPIVAKANVCELEVYIRRELLCTQTVVYLSQKIRLSIHYTMKSGAK